MSRCRRSYIAISIIVTVIFYIVNWQIFVTEPEGWQIGIDPFVVCGNLALLPFR
jgi:hypothetical protein